MTDRDAKRYAQKETVTATISAGTEGNSQHNISARTPSLLNIALILGLLMQD